MIGSVWGNANVVKTLLQKSSDRHKREITSSSTEEIDINLKAYDGDYSILKSLYDKMNFI